MRTVWHVWGALVVLVTISSVHVRGARKVPIKIVSRPKPESEMNVGPFPIRTPMQPAGPMSSSIDSLPCLKDNLVHVHDLTVLVDICPLRNVTFAIQPSEVEDTSNGPTPSAQPANEPSVPTKQILGIYRGWEIDPILMRYKMMVLDDGDICDAEGNRFSFKLELMPTDDPAEQPQILDIRSITTCSYRAKLRMYVERGELYAQEGVRSQGVLDISDPSSTLLSVCGEMKCKYDTLHESIEGVKRQVDALQQVLEELMQVKSDGSVTLSTMALSSAKSILQSSNAVLDGTLMLVGELESAKSSSIEENDGSDEVHEESTSTEETKSDDNTYIGDDASEFAAEV